LVDILSLALTHGLMAVALWRLLWRDDLEHDAGEETKRPRPWLREPAAGPDADA
jgi:hypothetical protein